MLWDQRNTKGLTGILWRTGPIVDLEVFCCGLSRGGDLCGLAGKIIVFWGGPAIRERISPTFAIWIAVRNFIELS